VLSRWSPLALSLIVDSVFFINLCNWIFKCGCRSLWAGADLMCNIHMAHARHCPFCAHGSPGQAAVMIAIIAPQIFLSLRSQWSWPLRLVTALAMFPLVEGAAALVLGWADGYWNP